MLGCCRNSIMTGQAEPIIKGQQLNSGTFDLVTVIAVAVPHGWMDHLPKQAWITGTVLCVAVNAPVCDRIVLMGCHEFSVASIMTG